MKSVQRLALIFVVLAGSLLPAADFGDKAADLNALPTVPDGFTVTMFAREPLVRQPCSMAFDARGRLFVGMGPQYRSPTPETPADSVVMVLDSDQDGSADQTKVFATGFNNVQGLAWHGRDLWVANAPDLTLVRDLDGDDVADEYIRVYSDLGNLEHGLHGLTWAPDGRLYMSKGNSKGLSIPGRYAPRPFRDLWGVTAPEGTPDFPLPEFHTPESYQHAYHDPADDWGMDGGILRCDDGGANLEIVARGFRNPWDIALDDGFNWLGTDNDQTSGDRVFMPFDGAHFGWNHPWSSHWSTEHHAATAAVSGPLFEGSGTGVIFGDSPQFPDQYRGVYFINDWLRKTTFVWRPQWDGAMMRPAGNDWEPFIVGGKSLFRPTDLEFGPDGALWVLGWSTGYGAEWQDGQLSNEGRIYRIAPTGSRQSIAASNADVSQRTTIELIADFASPVAVHHIDAQDELVRRGLAVQDEIIRHLQSETLSTQQETWTAWTLGRMHARNAETDQFLTSLVDGSSTASLNLQIQAIRILAEPVRAKFAAANELADVLTDAMKHAEPRIRMAAVQGILRTPHNQLELLPELLQLLASEDDSTVFYAGWQALRRKLNAADLRALLIDTRAGVRRAALLSLLETHAMSPEEVSRVLRDEPAAEVRQIAELWQERSGGGIVQRVIRGRPIDMADLKAAPIQNRVAAVSLTSTRSESAYRVIPAGLNHGSAAYTDREYRFSQVPDPLRGLDLLCTANSDDGSQGADWLILDAVLPVRVYVGNDRRQQPPNWLHERFQRTEFTVELDEGAVFEVFAADFPAGPLRLGGNTDDGVAGGKGNYFVAVRPLPLTPQSEPATADQVLAELQHASAARGEVLFRHPQAAGCAKCHSLDAEKNAFGPDLGGIGLRANVQHLVQSLIDPSAVITEGFTMQTVVTDNGRVYSGLLLEESGLSLSLGTSAGERIDIPKRQVDERQSSRVSAMPVMTGLLSAAQIADLVVFLQEQQQDVVAGIGRAGGEGFSVRHLSDRLVISSGLQVITEYVFSDEQILRPYFSQVRTAAGQQLTRSHPPVEGVDSTDHATMHPGIWLAFGDLSGHDFWRNKGRIAHQEFLQPAQTSADGVTFATRSLLLGSDGMELGRMDNHYRLWSRPQGWALHWRAVFSSATGDLVFGDQEEMGFAARMATALTEKETGRITSSSGRRSAKETWGQAAEWCDYSGRLGDLPAGIMLIPSPDNFRGSWWHNRDYGVFVANPFGRAAMQQGEASRILVPRGEEFQISFTAVIHSGDNFDLQEEFRTVVSRVRGSGAIASPTRQ